MKHYAVGTYKRNSKGEFVTGSWFKRMWVSVKWWSAVITLGLVGIMIVGQTARAFFPKTEYVKEQVLVDNLAPKIDELKSNLVEAIQKCESKGHKESDGIIIFDSNSEASIGTLQFQRKTVQYYYKHLYGKTITAKEAVLIALDDEKAEQLAHDIIFKDSKGVNNWYNCANSINAKGQLTVIKTLQK